MTTVTEIGHAVRQVPALKTAFERLLIAVGASAGQELRRLIDADSIFLCRLPPFHRRSVEL
jgi:hypothetical protein